MKVVTSASYYGSGSSAFLDLVSEYDNVKSLGSYEFRFLHDIDGVSDLEFHLVECQNRHNSGHALKRFYKLSKFYSGSIYAKRYEPFFHGKYLKATEEYISALTDFKFKGWWFYDLYDKGNFYYFKKSMQNHICNKLFHQDGILKKEMTYASSPSLETFLKATQDYTHKLFLAANDTNKEFLEIDQIVPSTNVNRVLRYFKDDVHVFIVDRDPRDIYLLGLLVWKGGIIPSDVELFCKWYKYARKNKEKNANEKVMFIQFEDLIYKYDETVSTVEKFLGLSNKNHVSQFAKFDPKRSIVNTQVWRRFPDQKESIHYIEKELKEYLYDFPKEDDQDSFLENKNLKMF